MLREEVPEIIQRLPKDEKNKQLTRIYAISFPKQKELKEHLEMLEEAKKRDHRKLGKELELFMFSEKVFSIDFSTFLTIFSCLAFLVLKITLPLFM